MEKGYGQPAETKTLIKSKLISFQFLYWFVFIIIVILISWSDDNERLAHYKFTEGIVVDKVFAPPPRKSNYYDMEYAQWQYVAGADTLLFVDKQYFV